MQCLPNLNFLIAPFSIELIRLKLAEKKRVIKFSAHTMGRLNNWLKNLQKFKNQQKKAFNFVGIPKGKQ